MQEAGHERGGSGNFGVGAKTGVQGGSGVVRSTGSKSACRGSISRSKGCGRGIYSLGWFSCENRIKNTGMIPEKGLLQLSLIFH